MIMMDECVNMQAMGELGIVPQKKKRSLLKAHLS